MIQQQTIMAKEFLSILDKCNLPEDIKTKSVYSITEPLLDYIELTKHFAGEPVIISMLYTFLLMFLHFTGLALKKDYKEICLNDIIDYAKYLAENKL